MIISASQSELRQRINDLVSILLLFLESVGVNIDYRRIAVMQPKWTFWANEKVRGLFRSISAHEQNVSYVKLTHGLQHYKLVLNGMPIFV